MFVGESPRNPNDRDRVQPCRVGDELPQVAVVGALYLIFNENPMFSIALYSAQEVSRNGPTFCS